MIATAVESSESNIHLDQHGQIRLGEWEGYVGNQVEDQGNRNWTPLWASMVNPVSISGQKVVFSFDRPNSPDFAGLPLEWRSDPRDGIKVWPNYGFHVFNGATDLPITSVTIVGMTVEVVVTPTLVPGTVLEVSYAYRAAAWTGIRGRAQRATQPVHEVDGRERADSRRVARRLGVAVHRDGDGMTDAVDYDPDILRRAQRERERERERATLPDWTREMMLRAELLREPQSDALTPTLAERGAAAARVAVVPLDDRPTLTEMVPVATIATMALVELGVIASDETPSASDRHYALDKSPVFTPRWMPSAAWWDGTAVPRAFWWRNTPRFDGCRPAPAAQGPTRRLLALLEGRIRRGAMGLASHDIAVEASTRCIPTSSPRVSRDGHPRTSQTRAAL